MDSNHLDMSDVKLIGGAILKARVKGTDGDWAYTSMCLDFFLTNNAGTITCDAPYVRPLRHLERSRLTRAGLKISVRALQCSRSRRVTITARGILKCL